jgi:translation initiation factor 4E
MAETQTAPSEIVTVFDDPLAFTVKHKLAHTYTLWFDCPSKRTSQKEWGDHLKQIISFDTAEDFWGIVNSLPPPAELSAGANYHIFKQGIEPSWEDKQNAKGGKWTYTVLISDIGIFN